MVLYKNNTGMVVFMDFGNGLEPISPGDTVEEDAARPMAPLELVLSPPKVAPTKKVKKEVPAVTPPKAKPKETPPPPQPQLELEEDEPEELS